MTEMTERVAGVLAAHFMINKPPYRDDYVSLAVKVISAMREPTDAMINTAMTPGECASYIHDIWRDMIDGALSEGTATSS